jgi:hypothetical protein
MTIGVVAHILEWVVGSPIGAAALLEAGDMDARRPGAVKRGE